MSSKVEERGVSAALGKIPQVNAQRAFSCTVTIAGTGLSQITVNDVRSTADNQHRLIFNADQMYVHEIRAFGSSGGYLSLAPFPHRQYYGPYEIGASGTDIFVPVFNAYGVSSQEIDFNQGSLTQMYEFGINSSTRPELKWTFPTEEVRNNPFTVFAHSIPNSGETTASLAQTQCKLCTVQSTNTAGDALYIIQFDITLRDSSFIPITQALGAAAFGERNVVRDNYKPPIESEKKKEEGERAHELANKKRKIENVKALTMPALDSH